MNATILVVDDDPAISEMLSIILESEGFNIVAVMDGAEAVSTAERVQPDLILLDLMLPGMNGIDICRTIRQTSSVPIVMLTAKTDTVDVVFFHFRISPNMLFHFTTINTCPTCKIKHYRFVMYFSISNSFIKIFKNGLM